MNKKIIKILHDACRDLKIKIIKKEKPKHGYFYIRNNKFYISPRELGINSPNRSTIFKNKKFLKQLSQLGGQLFFFQYKGTHCDVYEAELKYYFDYYKKKNFTSEVLQNEKEKN